MIIGVGLVGMFLVYMLCCDGIDVVVIEWCDCVYVEGWVCVGVLE